MLSYKIGTNIYKFLADIISKRLSRFDAVLGIYARRSLASGEIVFGKSDIDLTILIDTFKKAKEEVAFLCDLSDAYSHIKKIFPFVGECNIFNTLDLHIFYSRNTYEWSVDKNWLSLYGQNVDFPRITINKDDIVSTLLMWVFNALFRNYKMGSLRPCFNALLELSNGYYTYTGVFDEPKLKREEVLDYLVEKNTECEELCLLQSAFYKGFSKKHQFLKRWVYKECLSLCDRLFESLPGKLDGQVKYPEITSYRPLDFSPVRYVIIRSSSDKRIEEGLDAMEKEPEVVLITDKILNMYLYYYNPWEFFIIRGINGTFGLSEPPESVVTRVILKQVNKTWARYVGIVNQRYKMLYNLISQCRIYLDQGIISTTPKELREIYASHYGGWPFGKHKSKYSYFNDEYPILVELIDDIYQKSYSLPKNHYGA